MKLKETIIKFSKAVASDFKKFTELKSGHTHGHGCDSTCSHESTQKDSKHG